METLFESLRWMGAIIGILLLYAAIFLYEDDRKKIQNHLDDLWFQIDDLKDSGVYFGTAFLQVLAEKTNSLIEFIYGPKIISLRAFVASICLSLISFGLLVIISLFRNWHSLYLIYYLMAVILLCISIIYFQNKFTNRICCWIGLLICIGILWLAIPFFFLTSDGAVEYNSKVFGSYFFTIAGSLLCDFLIVYLIRIILAFAINSKSFVKLLLASIFMMLIPLATYVLPMHEWDKPTNAILRISIALIGLSNALAAFATFVLFMLIVVLTLQRSVGPILSTILYPIANDRFIFNRKLLAVAGVVLISLKYQTVAAVLGKFIK